MNKTTNYQLNQWEAADQVRRTDFNEDNAKLDAALGALAAQTAANTAGILKLQTGQYTGDGAASRFISVGFTPRVVCVLLRHGTSASGNYYYGGLAVTGFPAAASSATSSCPIIEIVSGGFQVYNHSENNQNVRTNENGAKFNYFALG